MTTERASHANRHNAQASTGPRTTAGKARSGQNARKHGLSAVDPTPQTSAEFDQLAALIAGEHHRDASILEAARAVAEAQLQLQRVLTYKTALLRNGLLAPGLGADADERAPAENLEELLLPLEGLERYERRALSRRKFAIRRFNELVSRVRKVATEPRAG